MDSKLIEVYPRTEIKEANNDSRDYLGNSGTDFLDILSKEKGLICCIKSLVNKSVLNKSEEYINDECIVGYNIYINGELNLKSVLKAINKFECRNNQKYLFHNISYMK